MAQPRMLGFVCQDWECRECHSSGRVAALFWGLGSAASWDAPYQVILGGAQPHAGLSPICTGFFGEQ